MRISDWSSDVCSSDLGCGAHVAELRRLWVDPFREPRLWTLEALQALAERGERGLDACLLPVESGMASWPEVAVDAAQAARLSHGRSEEHTSELPALMRSSYAGLCLNKKQ